MPFRVAVIDIRNRLYPILAKMNDIEVVLLYGPSDTEIDNTVKSGCKKFIRRLDPSIWDKTFVSKEDIVKYRSTQLKFERYAQRYNVIPTYATSQYYHALAFWEYNLCDQSIDCLMISTDTEHGSLSDSVPIDVAKSKGIPVFLFDNLYNNSYCCYKGIRCENTSKYVNLKEIDPDISLVDVNDVLYPHPDSMSYSSHLLDILDCNPIETTWFKRNVAKLLKKMIILHSNICWHVLGTFGLHVSPQRYYEKDMNMVLKINALFSSYMSECRREKQYSMAMEIENLLHNYFKNKRYLSSLKRYYRKHSKRFIDPATDGILYALHFEPEASIMNRTIYNAQIYNIEMLSSVLPKGWKLFVKEHPHQFGKFEHDSLYYYKQIPIYRRKSYYNRLLEIPNVVLVDDRISSSNLLNPIYYPKIHAISTITGTISAESVYSGKPVIMFGSESTVYDNVPGIYKIYDKKSLMDAIDDLVSRNVSVDPQKIEKITEYLIEETNTYYSKELMHISEKTLLALITNSKKIAQILDN